MFITVAVCVVIGFGVFLSTKGQTSKKREEKPVLEEETIVPTTDASTVARLESVTSNKEVKLILDGIPNGTKAVDYELSYDTQSQGFQGIIGSIVLKNSESTFEKQVTLGTCSSGRCVYHQVVGEIKATFRFNGTYGEKILEKNFNLE